MVKSITQSTSNKIANMALLCAVLVVSIHLMRIVPFESGAWWFFALGSETISRMAVPFFFVCSGFFLAAHYGEKGWYSTALIKRFRTIVIPYFIFFSAFYLAQKGIVIVSNLLHHRHVCLFALFDVRSLLIFVVLSPVLLWLISRKWGGL